MKQLGFGSESQAASEKYAHLPVQHAVIMKNKEKAMEVVTPKVDKTYVPDSQREKYIRERLQDPWYLAKYEIEEQIKSRIKTVDNDPKTRDTRSPIETTAPDRKIPKRTPKTGGVSLFDLGAEAEEFIRNNKTPKKDGK